MAIMIPSSPVGAKAESLEDYIFACFQKSLSDDYFVFYSLRYYSCVEERMKEGEVDFIVFHPKKGLLFIEAKAGQVSFDRGRWFYGRGLEIKKSPVFQAETNKWSIFQEFKKRGYQNILLNCKFIHAVCFPSINQTQVRNAVMPAELPKEMIICYDDLEYNLEGALDRIFAYQVGSVSETNLTASEAKLIVEQVLCPSFHLVELASTQLDNKERTYARLLKNQAKVLDFLEEQPDVIIHGAAGTGKTLVAVEQAKRYAEARQKVLFLCFNKALKEHLENRYNNDFIDFFTIHGLAKKLCGCWDENNLLTLADKLLELAELNQFPYQHIIIDEGQDFGQEKIRDAGIIDILKMIVLSDEIGGSFYFFYDKNQMIQVYDKKLPDYIQGADCKLGLYKNCRNTTNIATSSIRPIAPSSDPKMMEGAIKGDDTQMFISPDVHELKVRLDAYLRELYKKKYNSIVILSCTTIAKTMLRDYLSDDTHDTESSSCHYKHQGKKIAISTCRKFKGLEADAIILIDVDSAVFAQNAQAQKATESMIFYVGASRARFSLLILAQFSDEFCMNITGGANLNRSHRKIASSINAKIVMS